MNIAFKNRKIEKLCTDWRVAEKNLGESVAKKLALRLQQLENAFQLSELFTGHPHPLTADRQGQFAIDLNRIQRLIIEPAHPVPTRDDDSIDWDQVTSVCIVEVVDYHG